MAAAVAAQSLYADVLAWSREPIAITSKVSVTPYEVRGEVIVLFAGLAFWLVHLVGKSTNRRLAHNWVREAMPLIEKEFATTAKDGQGKGELLLWNGGDEAVLYASGRRSVESMHAHFSFTPRHDPLLYLYHFISDIALATPLSSARDTLTLTFQLPTPPAAAAAGSDVFGVFAIVDKRCLQSLRSARPFDLSFARLLESNDERERRGLSQQWAVMSENAELTDGYLGEVGQKGDARRNKVGIQTVLNSAAGEGLESLILTDVPQHRPDTVAAATAASTTQHARLLILNLRVPRSAAAVRAALPLLLCACNIADAIDFNVVPPLTDRAKQKMRTARQAVDAAVLKELQEEEGVGTAAEEKAKSKRKDRGEMSDKELAKRKELEEKRARRKAQGKMKVGGRG